MDSSISSLSDSDGFDIDDKEEENSVLTALFNRAADVVQANATVSTSAEKVQTVKPSDKQLLELYGLYKVATCGPCNESQPGIFNMKARSKWSSWKDKSELSKEDAMNKYITQVKSIYNWIPPSVAELTGDGDNSSGGSSNRKSGGGGFAPAVSRPRAPEDEQIENTPFDWIKDNEISKIQKWLANETDDDAKEVNVNLSDEDGLSLLHWAVDRGRIEICEALLEAGADPTRKDEDDQTPLDYAITCDHNDIIKLLEKHQENCSTST